MKKAFVGVLAMLLFSPIFGQHLCAISKTNGMNNSRSAVVSSYVDRLESRYDVKFCFLDLAIERTSKYIKGNVKTTVQVEANSLDTFACELHPNLSIDSILVGNNRQNFSRTGNAVLVPVSGLVKNDFVNVTIYYKGTPPTSGSGDDGFSNGNSTRWGNQVTWSLSEPFAAFEWWPCKQSLRDKIDSSWVFVTTDATNKAGSNGLLTNVTSLPNNKKRYEWKSKNVIDYYLISATVAEYVEYSNYAHPAGYSDSILVQNFIYNNPQTLPTFQPQLDTIPLLIEYFSEILGLYPFANEKYGHCMAPFSGGMEHQTMTSQGFFEFTINAHELGHQWFGDNVTCKTWNDIFINEGFASYTEYLALAKFKSYAEAQTAMASVHNRVMASSNGSVFCPDSTSSSRIFDSRLSYDKGSAMVHSLRYEINNDSTFFDIIKTFQNQYRNSTASIDDLRLVFENKTGRNFQQFFNQWIYGEGYPTFNLKYNQVNNTFILVVQQTASFPSVTPLFKTPLDINIKRTGFADSVVRVNIVSASDTFYLPLAGSITALGVDPANWILNKVGTIQKITALTTAIEDIQHENISVYPNPVKDKLFIANLHSKEVDYSIYNNMGQMVQHGKVANAVFVENLSNGLYFLEINQPNFISRIRFIKN